MTQNLTNNTDTSKSLSNLNKRLASILNCSQESTAAHAKQLTKCQQLYLESDPDEFFKEFISIIENVMITMVKNPNVDRIIDFVSKFAVSLSTSSSSNTIIAPNNNNNNTNGLQNDTTIVANGEQSQQYQTTLANNSQTLTDEIENIFLVNLINYLLNNHKANSDAVRYRCCHIISKLMASISSEQFIDEELFDRLCDALLERLKDINSRVQVQAVSAIYRLQDPNDRDCRVIKALSFLMSYDPHWQVRYQALSHIAFSKQTLPNIIDRVRDSHPNVRRKALLILSEKVLIKFISIEKRLFILNYSLKDDEQIVQETCCKKLLPSWLAFKENNIIRLLKALDVVEATETIELMLNKMYADDTLESLCKDYTLVNNEKHLIDIDKLEAESVMYWRWLCERCKSEEADECIDSILPSLTEFCEYVQKVIKKVDEENLQIQDDERRHLENNFMIKQLIKMFNYLDMTDVHGKKSLISLCHEIFASKNYTFLFDTVMSVYKLVVPVLQQRVNNITELISDLRDPLFDNETPITNNNTIANINNNNNNNSSNMSEHDEQMQQAPTSGINTPIPRISTREIEVKIAELKFERIKLADKSDQLYNDMRNNKEIDLNEIGRLRDEIKKLDKQINDLKEQLQPVEKIELTPVAPIDFNQTIQNQDKQQNQQHEQQQNGELDESMEYDRIYHCLQLAVCLLQDVEHKTLLPQLRSLADALIIPNIGSVYEEIRALAVRGLNLVCILKLEVAQKYVPLMLEMIQHDKKEIVIEAFKSIINCIMAYSLNKLIGSNDDTSVSNISETTSKVISIMTSLLDHEDDDTCSYAVEGFCKLFMTGHIVSAKLFSKLLIMYYSPLTENEKKLRACLACFLPQYSFLRSTNQICVEESFMITIKSLINAPSDSYLSQIDLIKVVEVLLHLTNPKNVFRKPNQRQLILNTCHENIGKAICFEILGEDNTFKSRIYLKILNMIDLSSAEYLSLKDMKNLADQVEEHIFDKNLKKTAKKFAEHIESLMSKMPDYIKEKEAAEKASSTVIPNNTEQKENGPESQDDGESETEDKTKKNKKTSLNASSDIIDFDFKKLNKKAKVNRNNDTTVNQTRMNSTMNRSRANAAAIKECRVVLERISIDSANVTKTTARKSTSKIPVRESTSKTPARGATSKTTARKSASKTRTSTDKNETINKTYETRSRKNSLNTTQNRTLTNSPANTTRGSSLRLSRTPKDVIDRSRLTNRKSSESKILKKATKTHASSKPRTQSESPGTSVEYEPPSKLRRSSRVTQTSRSGSRTSKTTK